MNNQKKGLAYESHNTMKPAAINQPLTDAEFDRLSDFLDKAGMSAMNIEGVDGFLAALICGLDLVSPSEYLPHATYAALEYHSKRFAAHAQSA